MARSRQCALQELMRVVSPSNSGVVSAVERCEFAVLSSLGGVFEQRDEDTVPIVSRRALQSPQLERKKKFISPPEVVVMSRGPHELVLRDPKVPVAWAEPLFYYTAFIPRNLRILQIRLLRDNFCNVFRKISNSIIAK